MRVYAKEERMQRNKAECGTRMLEEYLDASVCILMRDSSLVYGVIRSFDQYHNILIQDACEVKVYGEEYSKEESDVLMIRGENITTITHCKEDESTAAIMHNLTQVEPYVILERTKRKTEKDLNYITL